MSIKNKAPVDDDDLLDDDFWDDIEEEDLESLINDNYGYGWEGYSNPRYKASYDKDNYSKIFNVSYSSHLKKLINTPFSYNNASKQWYKKENKKTTKVDFDEVIKEVPDYILDDLMFSMNEL